MGLLKKESSKMMDVSSFSIVAFRISLKVEYPFFKIVMNEGEDHSISVKLKSIDSFGFVSLMNQTFLKGFHRVSGW